MILPAQRQDAIQPLQKTRTQEGTDLGERCACGAQPAQPDQAPQRLSMWSVLGGPRRKPPTAF